MFFVVGVAPRGVRSNSSFLAWACRAGVLLSAGALAPSSGAWPQDWLTPPEASTVVVRLDGAETYSLPIETEAGQVIEILADHSPGRVELRLFEPGIAPCLPRREDLHPESGFPPVAEGELRSRPFEQRLETVTEWSGTYRLEVRSRNDQARTTVTLTFLPVRPATFEDQAREESLRAFWQGRRTEARADYERSLRLATLAADARRAGWARLGLGWVEPDWPSAIPHFATALQDFTAAGDLVGVTRAHQRLARAAAGTGDPAGFEAHYTSAAEVAERLGDPELTADVYWRWGRTLLEELKRPEEAREKIELARRFAAASGHEELIFLSELWTAKLDREQFALEAALEGFRRSVSLASTLPDRAAALNDLGILYDNLGEYQRARDYQIQSVATYEQVHLDPTVARDYANVLINLGNVSQRLGDSPTALYERARMVLPADAGAQIWANLYRVLAWAYASEKRPAEARRTAEEALRVTADLPDEHAISRGYLGEVLLIEAGDDRERLEEARETLQQALDQYAAQPAPSPVPLARRYEFLGEAHRRLRDFSGARGALLEALEINQRIDSLIDIALDHYFLARIERESGDLAAAQVQVEKALETYQKLRARVGAPEAQASFSSARPRDVQEFYVDLLLERHLLDPRAGFERQALLASERARGQSLLDLVTQGRTAPKDVPQGLLEQRDSIRLALRTLDLKRSEQLTQAQPSEEARVRWRTELLALESDLQAIDERIRGLDPGYDALMQAEPATVEEIQALLDDDTVLLEYLLGDARSYLFVVTKSSVTPFTLSARTELESQARGLHGLITGWNQPPQGVSLPAHRSGLRRDFQRLATELGRQLLGPPGELLGRKRLAIVADGALEYIPFGALTDTRSGTVVIENHSITRLPSASVLAAQRRLRAQKTARPAKNLAVFADPRYVTLPRLDFSREEAQRILASVPEGESLLKLDTEASRETLLATDLSDYRVLHFAVHGKIDAEVPNFSKLVLAEVDAAGRTVDGGLTLTDIYGLSLEADLVVLSACDTALGKNVRGEGLLGLTRGFLYAGAERVVSTLWQVQDESTTQLMDRFYRAMFQEKMSPSDALQVAQNEMRRQGRNREREFPYYWAGFVLQGEWSPPLVPSNDE